MNILILYFSGTGNTKAVAETLMDCFLELGHHTKCLPIEDSELNNEITGSKWDFIGLGYPVHAFNAPPIVYDKIKTLTPVSNTQKTFLFYTAGGPAQFNDASTLNVRRSLASLNYKVVGEKGFYLSANMLIRYPDSIIRQLFKASQQAAHKFVEELLSDKATLYHTALLFRMISWMGLIEHMGAKDFGKTLNAQAECTGCGICISTCPTQNIEKVGERIVFKNQCTFCMACIYKCPEKAIRSKLYNFFVLKGAYNIKDILQRDDSAPETARFKPNKKRPPERITAETKGYYGIFKKYLKENNSL